MRVEVANIFGMLVLDKITPIFEGEIARLRQEGHNGKYLIGISELEVKFDDNKIIMNKPWEAMKFIMYDNRQFYKDALESQTGNEILMEMLK